MLFSIHVDLDLFDDMSGRCAWFSDRRSDCRRKACRQPSFLVLPAAVRLSVVYGLWRDDN